MTRNLRRGLLVGFVAGLAAVAVALGWVEWSVQRQVERYEQHLKGIAEAAAAELDPSAHVAIRGRSDATSAPFIAQREVLRSKLAANAEATRVFTYRATEDGHEVVLMTHETVYVGRELKASPEMLTVLRDGRSASQTLHQAKVSHWVSGIAPLKLNGNVIGGVVVERRSNDVVDNAQRMRWSVPLLWLVTSLLGLAIGTSGFRGALRGLRSLTTRIGGAGSAAVLVAVAFTGWLDHEQAREELITSERKRLFTNVRLMADRIDGSDHQLIAGAGDAEGPAFQRLRRQLRRLKEAAQIRSDVYTFRPVSSKEVEFVVMTNPTPFVGDRYELRDALKRTLDNGVPGYEGPYTDSHGTWISAFAPIRNPQGRVVGALQADIEMSDLIAELQTRAVQRLTYSILGILVAFLAAALIARSIARPIGQIATAAHSVARGNLNVRVDEGGAEEVDRLAKAINEMIGGLNEREQISQAFGKYIASEVVTNLLASGELSMSGEEREISVLISDIRGYTQLTESLGATEVVALLNEYFSMLIEEVVAEDGHVDKFMGDAMLCWFGAPIPHEDHAARAARSAKRMMERLAEWNADRVRRGQPAITMGIGIATGQVVVGNIGSAQHKIEYTAIGEAVNLSSRLCGQADSGVILAEDAVREASELQGWIAKGQIEVKGVSEPVTVHELHFELNESS